MPFRCFCIGGKKCSVSRGDANCGVDRGTAPVFGRKLRNNHSQLCKRSNVSEPGAVPDAHAAGAAGGIDDSLRRRVGPWCAPCHGNPSPGVKTVRTALSSTARILTQPKPAFGQRAPICLGLYGLVDAILGPCIAICAAVRTVVRTFETSGSLGGFFIIRALNSRDDDADGTTGVEGELARSAKMRGFLCIGLVLTLAAAIPPVGAWAASEQEGQPSARLSGTARDTSGQLLSNATVQIRHFGVGAIVESTTSGPTGEFSFQGLEPGQYIVEVVEAGRVVGMTSPVSVEAGSTLSVDVLVVSAGALAASGGAGFSLFGLGPTVSTAVLGAAGATAVTAVVSTRADASPSR